MQANGRKGQFARGKNNVPCKVNGGKALSYCMDGALHRATTVTCGKITLCYLFNACEMSAELLSDVIERDYRRKDRTP